MKQIGSNAFDKIKRQEILKAVPCYGLNGWSADEQTADYEPLLGTVLFRTIGPEAPGSNLLR